MFYLTDDDDDIEDEAEEVWNEDGIEDLVPHLDLKSLHPHKNLKSLSIVSWILAFLSFMLSAYQLSDRAIEIFLKFLKVLLGVLGRFSPLCRDIADLTPGSLYAMQKYVGGASEDFTRYVLCKTCFEIYPLSQFAIEGHVGTRCLYVAYPNHPHASMRQPCDTLLLKTVEFASGKKCFYPFKVYCYMSVCTSLEHHLQHPQFFSWCEEWRRRTVVDGSMEDVYDGRVWKEFQDYNGMPFLSKPYSFGLMINVDWFQPYKHIQYSYI